MFFYQFISVFPRLCSLNSGAQVHRPWVCSFFSLGFLTDETGVLRWKDCKLTLPGQRTIQPSLLASRRHNFTFGTCSFFSQRALSWYQKINFELLKCAGKSNFYKLSDHFPRSWIIIKDNQFQSILREVAIPWTGYLGSLLIATKLFSRGNSKDWFVSMDHCQGSALI